ncbi:DUF2312 domain-containing protein [Sneathiella sp.]|uniref:DUF2312 domain-containing protein n=1 Tax=Sneathiella sp. TaxID=1964365 RepID=UPI002FE26EA3
MADVGGVAADHLRSYIERIERLEEEKKGISNDIKEIFAEAKGTGFDVKAMRVILRLRKMDKADVQEQEYMVELYRQALGMLADEAEEVT